MLLRQQSIQREQPLARQNGEPPWRPCQHLQEDWGRATSQRGQSKRGLNKWQMLMSGVQQACRGSPLAEHILSLAPAIQAVSSEVKRSKPLQRRAWECLLTQKLRQRTQQLSIDLNPQHCGTRRSNVLFFYVWNYMIGMNKQGQGIYETQTWPSKGSPTSTHSTTTSTREHACKMEQWRESIPQGHSLPSTNRQDPVQHPSSWGYTA